MTTEIEQRFERSHKRVGGGLKKNAKWFLNFYEQNPDSLDSMGFQDYWDDLVTLAQKAADHGRRGKKERIVKVRMSLGSTLKYLGETFDPGTIVPIPESIAIGLVKGGSAEYVSPPPTIIHTQTSAATALNAWECAARWPEGQYGTRHFPEEERPEYQVCPRELKTLHEHVRSAIDTYLSGHEPILLLKDVCIRLGSAQFMATPPFSVIYGTEEGLSYSGVEAPVLVRFAQVFQDCGRYFRRCPECQKLYLGCRDDQVFCSGTCRGKAGMRALRNKRRAERSRGGMPKPLRGVDDVTTHTRTTKMGKGQHGTKKWK